MIDEHKLLKERARGAQAETLLSNELFQEAFKTLEVEYTRAWAGSSPHEVEARENYWRALNILSDVRRHILKVANSGKLAKRELDDLANKGRPRAA